MNQDQIIGKYISSLRKKLGFTQDQVAIFLQINREEVSYNDNGKRSAPSNVLSQLAKLYSVDEYDFFEEDIDIANVNFALAFRADRIKFGDLVQIAKFK